MKNKIWIQYELKDKKCIDNNIDTIWARRISKTHKVNMKTSKNKVKGFKKSRKPRYVTEERLQEFGKELSAEIRKDMVTEERLQEFGKELSAEIRKDMVTEERLQEFRKDMATKAELQELRMEMRNGFSELKQLILAKN